jgi:hypothetical protein
MNDQEYSQIVAEFKRAGWVMGILGALGMLARLVFTNEKFIWSVWLRKIVAASIIGILVHFALHDMEISEMYKSVLCSISGSFAPELFEFVKNKILRKISSHE